MLTITPSMDDVFPGFLQSGHPNTRSLTTVILKHVLNKKKMAWVFWVFFIQVLLLNLVNCIVFQSYEISKL